MILLIRRGSFYKAKKLATIAYWDNFEYIEKPLGKETIRYRRTTIKSTTK